MFLRLLITFSLVAPPTEEAAQAAYSTGDFEAALQMYLELARAPDAHPPQALDGAHTTLRALHRKDPKAGHLCRARDMARELLQRDDFASEQERGAWTELEAEDTADLAGVSCPAAAAEDVGKPTPSTEPAPPAPGEASRSGTTAQAQGPRRYLSRKTAHPGAREAGSQRPPPSVPWAWVCSAGWPAPSPVAPARTT
ncbi:hypothetical protein [Nannocystis pusilla]|uniref:hypothetical protein n=1 Tax=Nannocystis pusilla TaxID=889268 RepID=UPI003B803D4F